MFDSFRYPIPLGGVYRGEQEDPPDLAQVQAPYEGKTLFLPGRQHLNPMRMEF